MLDGIKRLFSGGAATPAQDGWEGIAPWAQSKQYAFRGVQNEGFVIDGRLGATPWRLEWGPSQRPYIAGQELRIRAELGLPADLQVVLMNRQLQEAMEKAVFEQYVEGVQTRIDNQTPPEMRWLVMYPKLGGSALQGLREHFGGVAKLPPMLTQWLDGPLAPALEKTATHWLRGTDPLVLVVQRNRLTLRCAMAKPDIERVQAMVALFELALRELRRVNEHWQLHAGDDPSTHPSLWARSALDANESELPP
jgi:hypothetical protein